MLGLILGSIAENGFVQGFLIGSAKEDVVGEFFGRPLTMGIIAFILLGLLYPLLTRRSKKNRKDKELHNGYA